MAVFSLQSVIGILCTVHTRQDNSG